MPLQRTRSILVLALFPLLALLAHAQFKTTLVNSQGATAPCMGIGAAANPLVKKCVELFQQAGFIREDELGYSGLTIGTSGKDDGTITAIAAGSPAEHSGLKTSDLLVEINDHIVQPTPVQLATKALFGERGAPVHLKLSRNGAPIELDLTREGANPPAGPKSPNFFIVLKPMLNWRGQFVPCVGAGPAAMGAIEYCYGHFKPFGYIKLGDFATTGITLDPTRADKAIITAVAPNSAAAKAAIQPGDEILEVDSKPLTAHLGDSANELLYGKAGDTLHVTINRSGTDVSVDLNLVTKAFN